MTPCGILLDVNVMLTYCLRRRRRGFSLEFINFLEMNPKVGVTTPRIENMFFEELRKYERAQTEKNYRYGEIKIILKKENIDKSQYERNFKNMKRIFFDLSREDTQILTEAFCLTSEYNPLYLASLDRDFLKPSRSREIERRFQIKCRYPINILKEIETNV
jgi:hypothetical protein